MNRRRGGSDTLAHQLLKVDRPANVRPALDRTHRSGRIAKINTAWPRLRRTPDPHEQTSHAVDASLADAGGRAFAMVPSRNVGEPPTVPHRQDPVRVGVTVNCRTESSALPSGSSRPSERDDGALPALHALRGVGNASFCRPMRFGSIDTVFGVGCSVPDGPVVWRQPFRVGLWAD